MKQASIHVRTYERSHCKQYSPIARRYVHIKHVTITPLQSVTENKPYTLHELTRWPNVGASQCVTLIHPKTLQQRTTHSSRRLTSNSAVCMIQWMMFRPEDFCRLLTIDKEPHIRNHQHLLNKAAELPLIFLFESAMCLNQVIHTTLYTRSGSSGWHVVLSHAANGTTGFGEIHIYTWGELESMHTWFRMVVA